MCQLAEVSRASFYQPLEKRERVEEELFLANSRTRLSLERLARYALLPDVAVMRIQMETIRVRFSAPDTTNLPPQQVPARSGQFRRFVFARLKRPAWGPRSRFLMHCSDPPPSAPDFEA
jgi:hypothetical protein